MAGASPTPVWTVNARNADLTLDSGMLGSAGQIGVKKAVDPKTGRLSGISATIGAQSLVSLGYTYNVQGLVATRTEQDTMANRVEAFSYDSLDRLTNWNLTNANTPTTGTGFDYDTIGNLTSVTKNGTLADERGFGGNGSGPHTLSTHDATTSGGALESFAYDGQGRLTQTKEEDDSIARATAYTALDLPKSVTKGGQTWTFAYDAFGHRVKKSGPDGTTFYVPGAGLPRCCPAEGRPPSTTS